MTDENKDARENCCADDSHKHCGCDSHESCDCEHNSSEERCGCGCGHKSENADREPDFEALGDVPLPKPNLITFTTSLAQQAMISMGILPNPVTHKTTFMLNHASFLIDTIELIIEKTQGNRTDVETETLNNVVHELRMLYVAAAAEKKRREEESSASK